MQFIIALLGIIAAGIFFLYRMKNAASQGREIYDDVTGAVRRTRWSQKADARLIETLDDPRDAAAILLVQMASYDGEVTAVQKARIEDLMMASFGCAADEAQGFYSFGRMAIGQINDAANSLTKIMRPVHARLTAAEKASLVDMLEAVSEIEGAPTQRQRQLIAAVRQSVRDGEAA